MPSPVKWLTDEQYERLPLPERWLAQAKSQVGISELTGHNDGPEIDKYLEAAGKKAGSKLPYCAAGQTWCALQAGAKRENLPKFPAGVAEWRKWATEEGRRLSEPGRGMLGYWTNPGIYGEPGHIFIIAGYALGVLRTIEFNTNGEGSREGDGVRERFRTLKGMKKNARWGFIDLEGLDG